MNEKIMFPDGYKSAIECPNCPGHKLIVKTNRHTKHQFLGCPNWPDCNHTQKIPESWYMTAMGQPTLFDI